MAVKINKKIVGYSVLDKESAIEEARPAKVFQLGDPLSRPDQITGSTYKVKTPVTEHALYITINDVLMNEGTKQEHRRPFEIFVNSKNMEHFQWIVALTRVMSAVFRKGGDITFLVEELESVFDPSGGYYKKGGKLNFLGFSIQELPYILSQYKNISTNLIGLKVFQQEVYILYLHYNHLIL